MFHLALATYVRTYQLSKLEYECYVLTKEGYRGEEVKPAECENTVHYLPLASVAIV